MRLGVFQPACGGLGAAERVERLAAYLKAQPCDLLVCPELFLSGYNVGDELIARAEPLPGPGFEAMAALAAETGTAIVYGYPERDGPRLYNSAACVGPDGALLANHRKRFNSPGSFEERYFDTAGCATLFEYRGVRFAMLICYEVELTEFTRQAAVLGADVVLVSTALVAEWKTVAERLVPTRAFENGVWIAYANHAGSENGFDYLGGSRIVAPDGVEEAVAGTEETLVVADFDRRRTDAARARLPYLRDVGRFNTEARFRGEAENA